MAPARRRAKSCRRRRRPSCWHDRRRSVGSKTDAPAIPVNLAYRAVYGQGGSSAPVEDPEMTWAQVRVAARRLLPGVHYRRHLLWRYSLLWSKPRS